MYHGRATVHIGQIIACAKRPISREEVMVYKRRVHVVGRV
jgi:hypothetical protein